MEDYEKRQMLSIFRLKQLNQVYLYQVTYSLTDKSKLAFTFRLSDGENPVGAMVKSELGAYPASVKLETRIYF